MDIGPSGSPVYACYPEKNVRGCLPWAPASNPGNEYSEAKKPLPLTEGSDAAARWVSLEESGS